MGEGKAFLRGAYGGCVAVFISVVVACFFGFLVRVVLAPRLTVLSAEDLLQVVSTVGALFCSLLVLKSFRAGDSSPSPAAKPSGPAGAAGGGAAARPMDPAAAVRPARKGQQGAAARQGPQQEEEEEEEEWEDEQGGEPAAGGEDEDEEEEAKHMPIGFLSQCKGNRPRALKRWALTRKWRKEHHVDRMLLEPHRTFEIVKRFYPHFLHGKTKQGDLIMYELAGRMDIAGLRAAGLGPQDVARHSVFVQEFMWRVLDPSPEAHIMTVMDLGQMNLLRITSKDTLDVIRATSEVLNNHYPDRMRRILVVNLPGWMGSAWNIISAVLPPSIRDKVVVARSLEDLKTYIEPEHIPREYKGQAPEGDSEEERKLKQLVAALNEGKPVPADLSIAGLKRRPRRRTGSGVSCASSEEGGGGGAEGGGGGGRVPSLQTPASAGPAKKKGAKQQQQQPPGARGGGGRSTAAGPSSSSGGPPPHGGRGQRKRLGFRAFMSQLNCFKRHHHHHPGLSSSQASRLDEEEEDGGIKTQSFTPGSTLPASPLPYKDDKRKGGPPPTTP